jgi:hypothetical protein
MGGGGHGLISATQPARPVTRNSLRLCNCGLIHVYYLSFSFSYLRSAAGVSFDIKKACRKPYMYCVNILNRQSGSKG